MKIRMTLWTHILCTWFLFSAGLVRADIHPSTLEIPPGPEDFECGEYRLLGKLSIVDEELTLFHMYPGTTREYPVIVLDMPTQIALSLDDEWIDIEVKINRRSRGAGALVHYIKDFGLIPFHKAMWKAVRKVKPLPCRAKT
jgi:hypothetical protein